jgi:hypothetical protein
MNGYDTDMKHLEFIQQVLDEDAAGLFAAETNYKGSWKKRGGISAYLMLCRKWDRIENRVESGKTCRTPKGESSAKDGVSWLLQDMMERVKRAVRNESCLKLHPEEIKQIIEILEAVTCGQYDIFAAIEADERAEGLIDDIRDLRRYLVLVEAEMLARGAKSAVSTHRDNTAQAQKEAYCPPVSGKDRL